MMTAARSADSGIAGPGELDRYPYTEAPGAERPGITSWEGVRAGPEPGRPPRGQPWPGTARPTRPAARADDRLRRPGRRPPAGPRGDRPALRGLPHRGARVPARAGGQGPGQRQAQRRHPGPPGRPTGTCSTPTSSSGARSARSATSSAANCSNCAGRSSRSPPGSPPATAARTCSSAWPTWPRSWPTPPPRATTSPSPAPTSSSTPCCSRSRATGCWSTCRASSPSSLHVSGGTGHRVRAPRRHLRGPAPPDRRGAGRGRRRHGRGGDAPAAHREPGSARGARRPRGPPAARAALTVRPGRRGPRIHGAGGGAMRGNCPTLPRIVYDSGCDSGHVSLA